MAGSCATDATKVLTGDCDGCDVSARCAMDKDTVCTSYHCTADNAADVSDMCWYAVTAACQGESFVKDTCEVKCDFSQRTVSDACYAAVGVDMTNYCDKPEKTTVPLTFDGVTSANFANMKAGIVKALATSVGVPEEDVDAKYIGTARRSLSDTANVQGEFTVPQDDTSDLVEALTDATYKDTLNAALAASDDDAVQALQVTAVEAPSDPIVKVTTKSPTFAPTDAPVTSTTPQASAGALSMIMAAVVAMMAL